MNSTDINQGTDIASVNDLMARIAFDGPAPIAIVRHTDMKILFVNRQFENHLGYSNSDIANHDIFFTNFLEDYLQDRLLLQLNLVKTDVSAQSRFVIYPLKTRNGNTVPFN